jgi:hypothetical protein
MTASWPPNTPAPNDALGDRDRRVAELEAAVLRERVARATGVPAELLGGDDEPALRSAAAAAIDWKAAAQAARPPTAALPAALVTGSIGVDMIRGPAQIRSRSTLAQMTPAERLAAWRRGELAEMGAPPPPPRRQH